AVVSTSESPSPPGVPVNCWSVRLPFSFVFSPSMLPLIARPQLLDGVSDFFGILIRRPPFCWHSHLPSLRSSTCARSRSLTFFRLTALLIFLASIRVALPTLPLDRKSTRLNSSH